MQLIAALKEVSFASSPTVKSSSEGMQEREENAIGYQYSWGVLVLKQKYERAIINLAAAAGHMF